MSRLDDYDPPITDEDEDDEDWYEDCYDPYYDDPLYDTEGVI